MESISAGLYAWQDARFDFGFFLVLTFFFSSFETLSLLEDFLQERNTFPRMACQ